MEFFAKKSAAERCQVKKKKNKRSGAWLSLIYMHLKLLEQKEKIHMQMQVEFYVFFNVTNLSIYFPLISEYLSQS